MYGFWRLGLSPAPSGGAACVANGLETATSMKLKNTATRPRTGTAQASRSRPERLLNATAAAEKPVRTRSQRSSEPSCPPQNAEIVYAVGSSMLVWSATYWNEKSLRRSADRSTPLATAAAPKAAISAFCAETASLRRRVNAAKPPAKSA